MSDIYILRKDEEHDEYGELQNCFEWKVVFYCPCATSYPRLRQGVAGDIRNINAIEVVEYYEIVFIEMCNCKCVDLCSLDFKHGDYAYIKNKFWKIVGMSDIDDCGCHVLRFILERIEPRESRKKLIECISCFNGGCDELTPPL